MAAPTTAHYDELVLTFDNNKLIGQLFGQFDQHLALLEKHLGIEAVASGNYVRLKGAPAGTNKARAVLLEAWKRLKDGKTLELADLEGIVRIVQNQGELFTQGEAATVEEHTVRAKIGTRRKMIMARTATQERYIRVLERSTLIFGVGPAGTGKTYMAAAYAAQLLEQGKVQRLVLCRPAVEAGERIGFLPGDMREKVDPYLRPLYDALYDMMPADKVERGIQTGQIEIAPLAFMRGRTLANAAIILDEAQNCTAMQMKMFLTRIGQGSKMIVTGDITQIDLPKDAASGLADILARIQPDDDIGIVRFTDTDVVRHPLVGKIIRAYEG